MPAYQLQIKQVVDYPRCRIYRQFVHRLMADRSIRTSGGSGLFYFTVLCSYANFRTSYRRIDGISYTIYPGEWVCTLKEVSQWFRTRFQCQALTVLEQLQKQHFITFHTLDRGNVIRYKICDWARHNTVLEYNAPCQKDTGFFFLPVSVVTDLISTSRCSEMDIILDLWVSAVYNDNQVQGSDLGPVVYFRNGTGNPLVAYTELAVRWGLSRATVSIGRIAYMAFLCPTVSLMFSQPAFAATDVWTKATEIMQDVYTQILAISTIAAIVTASVALLLMNFSRSGKTVDESRAWLKRIVITWAILNSLGFIMSYIVPFFEGGQWAG